MNNDSVSITALPSAAPAQPDTASAAAPAIATATDSTGITADSTGSGTAAQQFPFGELPLPGVTTDSVPAMYRYVTEMSALENGTRFDGKPLPVAPAADTGVALLLILVFAAVAASYKRGARYLSHIFGALFKPKERNSIFDDTTINETQMRVSLLLLTFVTGGIALYRATLHAAAGTQAAVLPLILACVLLCAAYYLVQRGIYTILGNTFSDHTRASLFNESFVAVHLILGLFFAPAVLVIIYLPEYAYPALWLCLSLYVAARCIIIYSGIRIFLPRNLELLYIILYLCALEIVPLLLMEKAIPLVHQFVELNLLEP